MYFLEISRNVPWWKNVHNGKLISDIPKTEIEFSLYCGLVSSSWCGRGGLESSLIKFFSDWLVENVDMSGKKGKLEG